MPDKLKKKKIIILCNDCLSKNIVRYNFLGGKCPKCQSYNTYKYKPNKKEEDSIYE